MRAYGAMFYTNGYFPKWIDFEFYNYQVHDFKYNYKTAVFYSDIVVPLLQEEIYRYDSVNVLSHLYNGNSKLSWYICVTFYVYVIDHI